MGMNALASDLYYSPHQMCSRLGMRNPTLASEDVEYLKTAFEPFSINPVWHLCYAYHKV